MKKSFENLLGNAISGRLSSEKDIRDRIVIKEEFKALIPPLSDEELSLLEESIKKEGIRDALIIWDNGSDYTLVDGHNRFFLSQKLGLDFPFKVIPFQSEDEARDYMIINQLGRRNLSKERASYLRGLRYNREKAQGRRNDLTSDQNDLKSNESTAALLGKEYNVSEATIKRDGEFAAGIESIALSNPELKDKILKGEAKLSKQKVSSIGKKGQRDLTDTKDSRKASLTIDKLASIAYSYVQSERRSIEEIHSILNREQGSLSPKEYFTLWNELRS